MDLEPKFYKKRKLVLPFFEVVTSSRMKTVVSTYFIGFNGFVNVIGM